MENYLERNKLFMQIMELLLTVEIYLVNNTRLEENHFLKFNKKRILLS